MGVRAAAASEPLQRIAAIGRTAMVGISLRVEKRWRWVGLKLESHNPAGSIKDRTAYALVRSLESRGEIRPGDRLVESTSGNLGVALALISKERGYSFTAVVDPKVDPSVLDRVRDLGAEVVSVDEPDGTGGYLLTRLRVVREMVRQNHDVWPNQYGNPANPTVHYQQTGPELRRQQPEVDAVFVATSTGGTLAGIGRYFKAVRPQVHVVGVDVPGSRVFANDPAPRVLNGIGSSCQSQFLRPGDYDDVVIVSDRDAVAACHVVHESLGIGLGGSSGAALAASARYLADHPYLRRAVCICPDGRSNYLNSIYSGTWLADHAFCPRRDIRGLAFDDVRLSP
ncbi:MAG: N-(2-amino-2-carboxyethyl)-L-glutamate synthase [Solirubrobacteraceae bacterium]|jgi:N-(2-amino-2-carboxyethyl)-L-glutamate synthase|nr:N-(2-amino-2-carboxyethyl)-L-glutamate synthase [Solirubrobacteraceae bacterium]